jgi:putative FmdB family regulatory protein
MPTYEFKCPKCYVHCTEERTLAEGSDPGKCLGCKTPLVRVYSFSAVTFHGTGFYTTDK